MQSQYNFLFLQTKLMKKRDTTYSSSYDSCHHYCSNDSSGPKYSTDLFILRVKIIKIVKNIKTIKIITSTLSLIIVLFILFIFSAAFVSADILINEIMYNPSDCNDSSCEWIELFNNNSEESSLINCTINNKLIQNVTIPPNSFLILTRNLATFHEFFSNPYLATNNTINSTETLTISAIEFSMSLSNSGSTISLTGSEFCNDTFDYSPYTNFANGNNYSLEKNENLFWVESIYHGGSPGYENTVDYFFQNDSKNNETFENNTKYTPNLTDNITHLNQCDIAISIEVNAPITSSKEFTFEITLQNNQNLPETTLLNSNKISVIGNIQDINGVTVKSYSPWTNESINNKKSKIYSPNLGEGVYQLTFFIDNLQCNDSDQSNNLVTTLIAINPEYKKYTSSFQIETLYLNNANSANWGDQFQTKIIIYKGNDTKQLVEAYVIKDEEIISKKTKINLFDSFQEYSLTLPIQLIPNCDHSITDGLAKLIIEGLNLEASMEFEIVGIDSDFCVNQNQETSLDTSNTDILSIPDEVVISNQINPKTSEYQLFNFPINVSVDDSINFSIQIQSDDKTHNYSFYAYLYKGAWCYSCESNTKFRNETIQSISLTANKNITLPVNLNLDNGLTVGEEYKVKIKIFKDNHKTADEITENILIINQSSIDPFIVNNTPLINLNSSTNNLTTELPFQSQETPEINSSVDSMITSAAIGTTLYESTSKRTTALVPILLLISSLVLLFILWKAPHRNP